MIRKYFILLIVLVVFAMQPVFDATAAAERQGYQTQTIMVYIVGSNLESDSGLATADIAEMLRARPDRERLNVLVMTGGTTRWVAQTIPEDKLSVYKIEGANPKLLRQTDSMSMGNAATLADFLDYGAGKYPADSYGLVLWDHAGGPLVGFGSDTAYRDDKLTLAELRDALGMSSFGNGLRLEWVAFDACLMASSEVAALMSQYARYLIASEETMPGRGFNYRFLADLKDTGLTGPDVARAVIDRTYAYYEEEAAKNPKNAQPITLSLLDLGKANDVRQALDRLFTSLDKGLQIGIYSDIARRRDGTKSFARTTTTNEYDLIDLADLCDNMAALYPDEAAELKKAILGMVSLNRTNVPRSNGLTVYFPLFNKMMYGDPWGGLYQELDFAPAYKAFVDNFGKILLADSLSNWTGADAPAIAYDEGTGGYFIQLTADQAGNYDMAQYYVLARISGEEYTMAFMSSDVTLDPMNRLRANFNGKTMFIDDPVLQISVNPLMQEKENIGGIAKYQIPAVIDRRDASGKYESATANLLVEINKNTGAASITGAIRDDLSGSMLGKRDTDITQWDNVYFTYNSAYLTRGKEGELLPLGDWASSDAHRISTFPIKNGLTARYDALKAGPDELFVLISVMDTQGYVYSSELMPLKPEGMAPAAPPSGTKPEAKAVDYPLDGQKPVLLMDSGAIRLTLTGIAAGEQDAPEALSLRLLAENALDEQVTLDLDWAMVNGQMMNLSGFTAVPAGGQAVMRIDFPIPYAGAGSSLQKSGIKEAGEIRFRLKVDYDRDDIFRTAYTEEFQVNTRVPVTAWYAPEQAETMEPLLMAQGGGVRIELAATPFIADGKLLIPLKVTNDAGEYDLLRIAESSVNGIMAPFTVAEDIRPGSVMYAEAEIPYKPFVLPPEMAEYQYMFEGRMDNLEELGIGEVREFTLRFELGATAEESAEGDGAMKYLQDPYISTSGEVGNRSAGKLLLDPYTITFTDMKDYVQPLDTAGDVLLNAQGIRIVRLESDPEGKRLYIYNGSGHTIHIASGGNTKVDGAGFSGNLPIYATVSARKSAYATLFGYIPGIEPAGGELTFYIDIINLDENKLFLQSDKITLVLR